MYPVQTVDVLFLGEPARAFVYHSSALDKKKAHGLQREIVKDRARYDPLNKQLARQTFATAQILESTPMLWHTATPEVSERMVSVHRRGRPQAGTAPEPQPIYAVTLRVTNPTAEVIQVERQRRATGILFTSRMPLDAKTALDDYQGQQHNEHGFRWTQSPIHLGAFGVEKPARVAGLGYLWLLA